MSSKSVDFLPDWIPEDPTPGNRVAAFVLFALALVVGAILFSLARCSRPEPLQMIPTPMPAASSAAIATSSATVTASQSVRVTVRRGGSGTTVPVFQPQMRDENAHSPVATKDQDEEIVIEVNQALAAGATSSAQASASVERVSEPYTFNRQASFDGSHGRLGVIAATMPGILAADLQLFRLDVSPVTRLLVDVDMEIGLDVAGNLEVGAVGVTAGSKTFVGAYYWGRWNLADHGPALAVGLRF